MIEVDLCTPAVVNWSVLRIGVPLILRLQVRRSGADAGGSLPFWIALPGLLERTRHVISRDEVSGRDISGDVMAKVGMALRPESLWRQAADLTTGEIVLSFPGDRTARCLVGVRSAGCWHRSGLDEAHQRLRVVRTRVVFDGAVQPVTELRHDWLDLEPLTFPAIETSIVALIEPRAPYAWRGSRGDVAQSLDAALDTARLASDPPPVNRVATALAEALDASEAPRWRDADDDTSQAAPLLAPHAEWGAFPLDPAIVACEILEGRGYRPVLLVVHGGQHLVAAVLPGDATLPDRAEVCRDAAAVRKLIEDNQLYLIGSAMASPPSPEQIDAVLGPGVLRAIDIARCRPRVPPLPRPIAQPSAWIAFHLEQLQHDLATTTERSADQAGGSARTTQLDDPEGLFVSVSCRLASGKEMRVLGTGGDDGLLDQLRTSGPRRIAILADGGSGKTYLGRRFAGDLANRLRIAEPGDVGVLPIWFPLRNLSTPRSLLDTVARSCHLDEDGLRGLAARQRLVIVLDALDESGRDYRGPDDVRALLDPVCDLPNTSVVLTSRAAVFPGAPADFLPSFEIVHLLGWTDHDLLEFLNVCRDRGVGFARGPEAFHRFILASKNLSGLARTPLFARMIVETRDEIEASGDVRDELDLYRRYTMLCLGRRMAEVAGEQRTTYLSVAQAAEATAEIARMMFVAGDHALPTAPIAGELAACLPATGIDEFRQFIAEDVLVHGLLGPDPSRSGERAFRFTHVSIEHYFLAEHLGLELCDALARGALPAMLAIRALEDAVVRFIARILSLERYAPWRATGERLAASPLKATLAALLSSSGRDERHRRVNRSAGRSLDADVAFRNAVVVHLATGGELVGADLSELDLSGTDLSKAVLRGAHLDGARLHGSVLQRADLSSCSLVFAQLCDVDVTAANFAGADFADCELRGLRTDSSGLPILCGAANLDKLLIDHESRPTLLFLIRCLSQCAEPRGWAVAALETLGGQLARLDARGGG